MNTRLEYMYRDAENYKIYGECVLDGTLSIKDLYPYLFAGEFFIPSEVGLQDLQKYPLHTYDHIWHEIIELNTVDKTADVSISAKCFIEMFSEASRNNWNQNSVIKRLGIV